MLDWNDLQSFLAIARHGSLSAAARVLGVQQSTMGRRLDGMEARAGARLLQRTPRGFTLTPAGEAILGNVERIESEALAIERRISGGEMRLEGSVRVTTIETLAVEILMPAMGRFHALHPGIELDLVAGAGSLSLTRREADVALRLARPAQQDLAVRRIGSMACAIYAAPAYLAAQGTPDFGAGAHGHATILNQPDLMGLPEMVWFAGLTGQARTVLRSSSRFAQRAAALQGVGLVCLMRYLGDIAGLQRLTAPTPPPARELWLAVHNDIRHTPRIRAVTDFLAAEIRTAAARLMPAADQAVVSSGG